MNAYGPCVICGAAAGQPCIDRNREPIYEVVHDSRKQDPALLWAELLARRAAFERRARIIVIACIVVPVLALFLELTK
jgi:hypothetical protein